MEIIKLANGWAVKFPFDLKDNFKTVFKSAKWNPSDRQWEVGPRSGKRLKQWVELAKQAAEAAELDKKQLDEINAELTDIRADVYRIRAASEAINAAELLTKAKVRLEEAKVRLEAEKAAYDEKVSEAEAVFESVCDLDAISGAISDMKAAHGKVGSKLRNKFNEAQGVIFYERRRLAGIGFISCGLEDLYYINFNRPDRDRISDCRSIYELIKMGYQKVIETAHSMAIDQRAIDILEDGELIKRKEPEWSAMSPEEILRDIMT